MSEQLVLCQISDGIATVTLNNTAKFNALSIALLRRLQQVLDQIRDDRSVRAMIITGAGKAFCSGADLNEVDTGGSGGKTFGQITAEHMETLHNPVVTRIRELPFATISALNGVAAGGGVGLALAADIVLASPTAYFYLPFMSKLGIVPDVGSSWFLPRLLGTGRAMGMTLLGDRLTAERALQWGLIWECVEAPLLMERAQSLAQQLALLPAHAALETRRAYDASECNTLSQQLQYEADRQRELIDLPEFGEGVQAFMGKRTPVFRSR